MMETELEKVASETSGASSMLTEELGSDISQTDDQQQQQQQRKQWQSRSTLRSTSIIETANSVTSEELQELKQWFQWEKTMSVSAVVEQEKSLWQRQQRRVRCGTVAENERLKERVGELTRENYELTRQLKNERIRNRDEDASQRRAERQAANRARLETRANRRLKVAETAAVQQATNQIKHLEETIEEKDRTISKLEAEKFYLGERIFELTGVEEGFWSDETLTRPVISERERGLLQRTNSLNIHVSQLQRQHRALMHENEQLRRQMELERERPLQRERQQELQLLRKKNAELALQTKRLEEKVRSLEKKSKELPSTNGQHHASTASLALRERTSDNKQHQTKTGAWRWREKEQEMHGLTQRLGEREKEIGRLKEKLRELTKKLKEQHQLQYSSKESLGQQTGAEWNVLSQGSRELEGLLKLVSKERLQLERHFVLATQGLQRSAELDVSRYSDLEATNVQLRRQVEQLELLCKEQAEAAQQLTKRQQDREVLAERLKQKTEYSEDLENQLGKVIDKNAELTIENSDLKKQVQELRQFEAECETLRNSLSTVESECQAAHDQVAQLKQKMAGLDHVLRQMREAAEKKKELERQHSDAVNELRTAQAQLGLLSNSKNAESERAQLSQNIESLQSRIRELERKMELQNVRHDELLIELASLRRHHAANGGGGGGSTQSLGAAFDQLDSRGSSPDSLRYLGNGAGSTTRTTPLGHSASNLDALLEMDFGSSSSSLASGSGGSSLFGSSTGVLGGLTSSGVGSSLSGASGSLLFSTGAAQAAADLALSLNLSGQTSSVAVAGLNAARTVPTASTLSAPMNIMPPLSPLSLPALPIDAMNSIGTVPLHSFRHPEPESSADMLEIPGKGRCYVYLAKYTYDPFSHSPNDNPEAEVSLTAGDYVLVWGTIDEDGFFEGELLDGRKGLVPSNYIQRLQGEDLVEFHRAAVLGLQPAGDDSSTTSLPRELLGVSPIVAPSRAHHHHHQHQQQQQHQQHHPSTSTSSSHPHQQQHMQHSGGHLAPLQHEPIDQDDAARQALDWGLMELQEFLEDEEVALGVKSEGPVPPPRQLTLERQLNKSILIGWNHPDGAPPESGQIACYHVYVDGILRTTVRAGDRCRALIEGVDSSKPHRISVRSVTLRRRASLDAACTMLIGKEVPSAPTCVRVSHVTATSALISWLPANSNYQHAVCVNHVEVRTVKPGTFRHTISGLSPNTIYRVTVKAKNIRSPHFASAADETSARHAEKYCTHVEFRTLPKGVPDPPVDVQVELGPQDGTLLVTWLPVTINSQSGKSNGVPVTGYAVYADGRKVTEVDSPTGDHALLDITSIMGLAAKQVTVRTKTRESQSGDSVPTPVPVDLIRNPARSRTDGAEAIDREPTIDEKTIAIVSSSHQPDPIELWNLNFLATLKETLESDDRPSELSDIAEEPEEEDSASDAEMTNDVARANGPDGRRPMDANRQRNQYGNASLPGPIPSIEITKDSASERSADPYRPGRDNSMNPYDRNKPPGVRNAQHQQQQQQQQPGRRDNYYRGNQANDAYYQDGQRRPGAGAAAAAAAARGNGRQQTRIFVALFDYDPPTMSPNPDACDEELPFREGQLIKVRGDKDADGFYWGEVGGRAGYVPCNMVSEVQVDDERVAQELLKESGADGPSHSRGRRNLRAQGQPGQGRDRWGDIYANMPVRRMIALYDYDPQELSPNVDAEVELSFQTGDIIYIYGDMDDDGFYLGELRGQRGLVPSNFLTDAPPDYDPARKRQMANDKGPDRARDPSYYGNRRDRMDHDRMDPRDRGVSGAEGPPPPPRTTNHRPSDGSRDRSRGEVGGRERW